MEEEKLEDGISEGIKTEGAKTVGFELHEDGDKGEAQKLNPRSSTTSTAAHEEERSFNPRGSTSTTKKLPGTEDVLSHSSSPGEPEDTSRSTLKQLAPDVLSHSSSPGEPEDTSRGTLKPRGSKSTRFLFEPEISKVEPDIPDNASDSSDNLSYDAEQVMGLMGLDEHPEKEQRPHQPVPIVHMSFPSQMSSLSQKSVRAWHQSKGRNIDEVEHGESLSRIMNQVMPSQPEPPSTAQWPLLATGANRGKRRWVSKLCVTLSKQRAPHSSRAREGLCSTIESVCLARELRAPKEQVTGLLANPRQRSAVLVTNRGFVKSVQLPKLHPDAKQSPSNQGLCQRFQEGLAPSGVAPATAIPARHKFHPTKPGWQPWRTHKLSAFDRA